VYANISTTIDALTSCRTKGQQQQQLLPQARPVTVRSPGVVVCHWLVSERRAELKAV
jgi:hypothetical protein